MPRFLTTIARLALVALALAAPVSRAAETLKWSPRPGETLKYAFAQSNDATKVTATGQELAEHSEVTLDLTWKIDSVGADGIIGLTQTVDRARAKYVAPGIVVSFDSQDKKTAAGAAGDIARSYGAILGKGFAIRLNPRGDVLDVKVPADVTAALTGSPLMAGADGGSFFTEAGVKNILTQILPKLPKGPVEKGASWNSDLTLPVGTAKVETRTKYNLSDLSPLAKIDATLETTVTPPMETKLTVKVNKQSGAAEYAFDPAAGHLVSCAIKQSANVTRNDGTDEATQITEATLTFKLVK